MTKKPKKRRSVHVPSLSCLCTPCKTCGMKHYCNVNATHPSGWVRCGGCPPEKRRVRA
jgi:hypothetical protein